MPLDSGDHLSFVGHVYCQRNSTLLCEILHPFDLEWQRLQHEADAWALRLLADKKDGVEAGNAFLIELQQQYTPLTPSFATRLMRRLRIYEAQRNPALVLEWLENRIITQYGSLETLSSVENQQQVMLQTAIGNTITSMRTLNSIQWKEWFEHLSLVEQILRRDPAGVYARSTFATRDQYRHEIERLARELSRSEDDVARMLVAYAGRVPAEHGDRYRHIGYYLLDAGRSVFERHLGYRSPPAEALQRIVMRYPDATYLGALTGSTAALMMAGTGLLLTRRERLASNPAVRLALSAMMFFPASALAKDLAGILAALLRGQFRLANLRSQLADLRLDLLRSGLNLALIPDMAMVNLDAILRTLLRMHITRRSLLEWETADQAQHRLRSSHGHLMQHNIPWLVLGIIAGWLGRRQLRASWVGAAPVVADWLASPLLVAWVDQALDPADRPIQPDEQELLRRLARATWAFFEDFVTAEGNYLAPDNFQETPTPVIAYRTSTTNIGLQLLADLAACDFGYIGLAELTERTERVFATLDRFDRYRGHFLNWYDTKTLKALSPAYVSTVDNGNLAGHLLALIQGYKALRNQPVIGPSICAGLRDTLGLLRQNLAQAAAPQQQAAALDTRLQQPLETLADYDRLLQDVVQWAEELQAAHPAAGWIRRLHQQAARLRRDLQNLIGETDPATLAADVSPGMLDTPAARQLLERHAALMQRAYTYVQDLDFAFLFDRQRGVFVIGYNIAEGRRDNSFYDLLASEARLGSFVAIAKGDVPQEHWFQLGRALTPVDNGKALISWSGTMFEYLMPLLVMRSYPRILLDETQRVVLQGQIDYAKQRGVPWGISESAFNARDLQMNYQYRAFGVPGIGLKSGLGKDLVIASYATLLALPVLPAAALDNLRQLIDLGMEGQYGLYEAIDYTSDRLPPGASSAIIRSFMVHHQGMGLVAFRDRAITRWHADTTCDSRGRFFYIRDVRSEIAWSATYQPLCSDGQNYRVSFSPEKIEFQQRVAGIDTRLEVVVSSEDNAEIERITLVNTSAALRELEVTSYLEPVLLPAAADAAHPAFGNLFVETEFLDNEDALLATRRPRTANEKRLWAVHVVTVRGHTSGSVQYETDRAQFVGRGRTLADPRALQQALTRTTGAVLDPILSLRRRVRIVPGGTVRIIFTTLIAEDYEQACYLAQKYHDYHAVTRAFEMAWTRQQVELRHLGIGADDAHRFQRLLNHALYPNRRLRASPAVVQGNRRGQSGLRGHGISGDYPIVLVRVETSDELALVHELVQAHQYWRLKHILVDLVIVNGETGGYSQGLQEQILAQIRKAQAMTSLNQHGGIFVLRTDVLADADLTLLQTVACAILEGRRGSLAEQLATRADETETVPFVTTRRPHAPTAQALPDIDLQAGTDYGGFSQDGREYVINLQSEMQTPAPWVNVIANAQAGFIVSESSGGYSWSQNSRENRLTPWSNDPVSDPAGEIIYLRDADDYAVWSATPRPCGVPPFRIRHGAGYSSFENQSHAIHSLLTMFVPPDDSVKIFRLQLTNHSDAPRHLSVTFYLEWVLGVLRTQTAPFIITERDEARGAILAHNAYNSEFQERVAFAAASPAPTSISGDRSAFIGRNGTLARPLALHQHRLDHQLGAGLDPCAALRCRVILAPGEQSEVLFLLGQGADRAEAQQLIEQYRESAAVAAAFQQAVAGWQQMLQQIQVQTPQPEMDLLLNGWLLYQALACRILGRSAFYQSGGAYGFRDQLQDVMALVHAAPQIAREHIIRAAQRQFVEGDVQHWWHPPSGRGIRTSFADDYLWLPLVVSQYVTTTGDRAILDERLPFLEGRPLAPGEAEYYDLPRISEEQGTLLEHCLRAVERGLDRMGTHGLPLMGAGDWNDGMNMVGHAGSGESVWMGWFFCIILQQMADLVEQRGIPNEAERYRSAARDLLANLEASAWDGAWYLRAFFDDGTALGSAQSEECRIDSLPQSWAVFSQVAQAERVRQAMAAVDEQLVDRAAGLIKLFTPPFDHAALDPGYIRGYVPGVRENGGQYTHAAIWVIWAHALLGNHATAGDLFMLINPIRHAREDIERYKVEPYVVAADVYAVAPHTGRGGWTWYTGSASWLYRLGIEAILGIHRCGEYLEIVPRVPPSWPNYRVTYRYGSSSYVIAIECRGTSSADSSHVEIELDGQPLEAKLIPLRDDGQIHEVHVRLG